MHACPVDEFANTNWAIFTKQVLTKCGDTVFHVYSVSQIAVFDHYSEQGVLF